MLLLQPPSLYFYFLLSSSLSHVLKKEGPETQTSNLQERHDASSMGASVNRDNI